MGQQNSMFSGLGRGEELEEELVGVCEGCEVVGREVQGWRSWFGNVVSRVKEAWASRTARPVGWVEMPGYWRKS